ncbi:DHA2 family efflux MFS transporter permease subunit [Methanoregula sp.]|jgi:DHA2 family multidrug resistance protein|uniref:DHA2 family efflux MFS transporter permease subunit n=1 Tax=Methanoregula sp. TaxID=2052170 RepID=UPI003C1B41FF
MAENNRNRWLILLTVIVGTFLGSMDQTVVSLAVPKIMLDFNILTSDAGWIATAYILANAVFVPVWGKLGDTIGRKKVYVWGFSIFIVGSILAGLSWDLGSMILFRVIQAVASSADYPTAMAIIAVNFSNGKERAQALGIWSSAFALAIVFGPLIGGPLIDTFGWRSVFLINLPIGLIGIAMALTFIPESVSDRKSVSFDWYGAITLGISLALLVFGLDRGYDWGWTSLPIVCAFAGSGFFMYIFYLIDSRHPEPIIDFRFFRIPAFVFSLVNNFLIFMALMGGMFLIPIFDQTFLGLTATETGLQFIPMAFCIMLAAPIGAALVGRLQPRYVIALSTLVAGIGLFLFTRLDVRSGPLDVVIPLVIMMFGMGFGMSQRTGVIAAIVPNEEIGSASAVLALVRNVAGAFGIAIFATILNISVENNMLALSAHSVINVHTPAVIQVASSLMYLDAQILAYRTVFLIGSIILVIAAVLALLIDVKKSMDGKDIVL